MRSVLFASSAALLALLLVAAPGEAAQKRDAEMILPGYWEYTNRLDFLVGQTTVEKRCVRPDEVDKFLAGPSNRHYTCEYPTRVVGDGKAKFVGVCRDKRGREAKISAAGTYSPKAFHLDATLTTTIIAGIPLSPTAGVDAKWLAADCPEPPLK